MTKKYLLLLILASISLWTACARGVKSIATVTVAGDKNVVAVSLTASFTAKINGAPSTAVNWSVSGNSCTGSACGTIDASGVYTAPTSVPGATSQCNDQHSLNVTVTAISQADNAAQGTAGVKVLPIDVCVTPTPVQVGQGLVQQFTAVAIPDYVPQTFTWSVACAQGGSACGTLVQDATTSGLAVYTAPAAPPTGCTSGNCVTVTATSTLNSAAPSSTSANVTVMKSRVNGTYAFRFSGFDNSGNHVEMAGTVTFLNGAFTSGVVDEVIPTGPSKGFQRSNITAAAYVPSTATDNNTNEAGTLTLTSGASVTQFRTVLTSSGEFRMIESDGNGSGSGVMQKSSSAQFNTAAQKFVFLLTGVDSTGKRIAYAGLLPLDGNGGISGALIDVNEAGSNTVVCGLAPCNATGSYSVDATNSSLWHMTLTSGVTFHYDFFVASGQSTPGAGTPLTLYAVSTDTIDAIHPAVSGTIMFQDPNTTYDKTALNSSAVSHLDGLDSTGSNTSVALVVASGDSNGNINGSFDALNFANPPATVAAQNFTCTYTTGTAGRYVITLLGNTTTCTAPALPFVFYASGANRGFLLDQASAAVMAGAMDPQAKSATFADSALPGMFAMATASGATSTVDPLAGNVLLTFVGTHPGTAAATLYDPLINPLATGTYTIQFTGTGSISLTAQGAAHSDNFLFYAVDTSRFWMMQTQDTTGNTPTDPALIFMEQ